MLTNDDLRPVTLSALHRALRKRGWHPIGEPTCRTQAWQFQFSTAFGAIIDVLLSEHWDDWPLRCSEVMESIIAHDPALCDLPQRILLVELLGDTSDAHVTELADVLRRTNSEGI